MLACALVLTGCGAAKRTPAGSSYHPRAVHGTATCRPTDRSDREATCHVVYDEATGIDWRLKYDLAVKWHSVTRP